MIVIYSSDRMETKGVVNVNKNKYEILTDFVDAQCVFDYIEHGSVELPILRRGF